MVFLWGCDEKLTCDIQMSGKNFFKNLKNHASMDI